MSTPLEMRRSWAGAPKLDFDLFVGWGLRCRAGARGGHGGAAEAERAHEATAVWARLWLSPPSSVPRILVGPVFTLEGPVLLVVAQQALHAQRVHQFGRETPPAARLLDLQLYLALAAHHAHRCVRYARGVAPARADHAGRAGPRSSAWSARAWSSARRPWAASCSCSTLATVFLEARAAARWRSAGCAPCGVGSQRHRVDPSSELAQARIELAREWRAATPSSALSAPQTLEAPQVRLQRVHRAARVRQGARD